MPAIGAALLAAAMFVSMTVGGVRTSYVSKVIEELNFRQAGRWSHLAK